MADSKRVPNFTQPEKLYLLNMISQKYWKILEDKKTNRTSLDEKKDVWKEIEGKFNASGPMVCFRNADSLRRLYENKKELRRKLGEETKQRRLTGGGKMPPIFFYDLDKLLMSILNEKCLTGLKNPFDCDADEETPINMSSGDYEFEFIHDTEDEGGVEENPRENLSVYEVKIADVKNIRRNVKKIDEIHNSSNNGENIIESNPITPSHLHNALQKENDIPETESETSTWKKFRCNNLKPLNSAVHCAEPSGVTPTTKAKYRRRPMATRALTTSDISEKYNLLLDRRLTLIEKQLEQNEEKCKFEREEQKLKLELLNYEIQYKKTLLRNLGTAL